VLLDENFDATAIYEAERGAVVETLLAAGSKARNERGAMGSQNSGSIGRGMAFSRKLHFKPQFALTVGARPGSASRPHTGDGLLAGYPAPSARG